MPSNSLPPGFLERLTALVPAAKLKTVLEALATPPVTVFRCNTLRGTETETLAQLRAEGIAPTRLDLPIRAFRVPDGQRRALTASNAIAAGRVYIQNPSSMVPALVLNPQPGEEILDLAAAPGGKTLQMACLMENRGRIAAVESVRARFFRLRANLTTHGASCVQTYLKDGSGVWKQCPERFDRVLLDAPCSSEARIRSYDPDSHAHWSPRKVREAARKQKRLIHAAVNSLKPGGVLVYATCAFSVEENEAVVDRLLRRYPDALRVDRLDDLPGSTTAGFTRWGNRRFHDSLAGARRILPDALMNGFFLCRLIKTASTLPAEFRAHGHRSR